MRSPCLAVHAQLWVFPGVEGDEDGIVLDDEVRKEGELGYHEELVEV